MAGQQPVQAAQAGLCMLASIKKWVNTHYGRLGIRMKQAKFIVVYTILLALLLALNASAANK